MQEWQSDPCTYQKSLQLQVMADLSKKRMFQLSPPVLDYND